MLVSHVRASDRHTWADVAELIDGAQVPVNQIQTLMMMFNHAMKTGYGPRLLRDQNGERPSIDI
jgi:hypothetical protein